MRKLILICFLLIIALIGFVASYYLIFNNNNFYNTHTSAVCSGNVCQDYEITCLKGEIINSKVISGFVTFRDDWVDRRNEKDNRC